MRFLPIGLTGSCLAAAFLVAGVLATPAAAEQTEFRLTHADGQFQPAELAIPANKAVTLRVKNAGGKAIEFESKTMHVEKVIAAGTEAVVNVKPLKPGRYEYFDEFNEKARGAVVAK